MKYLKIPKKSGGFREIAIPNKQEKYQLRSLMPFFKQVCSKYCNPNIVHGFANNRSPITNAKLHANKKYTFTLDLKDWFDTVKVSMIRPILEEVYEEYRNHKLGRAKMHNLDADNRFYSSNIFSNTLINVPQKREIITTLSWTDSTGKEYFNTQNRFVDIPVDELINSTFIPDKSGELRAYQGLNTSPFIANLASVKMDEEIRMFLLKTIGTLVNDDEQIIFTRYADDLSFSFDNYNYYEVLKREIPSIIEKNQFKVNLKKVRLQFAYFGVLGNRKITGVNLVNKKVVIKKNTVNNNSITHVFSADEEAAHIVPDKMTISRKSRQRIRVLKHKIDNRLKKLRIVIDDYRMIFARHNAYGLYHNGLCKPDGTYGCESIKENCHRDMHGATEVVVDGQDHIKYVYRKNFESPFSKFSYFNLESIDDGKNPRQIFLPQNLDKEVKSWLSQYLSLIEWQRLKVPNSHPLKSIYLFYKIVDYLKTKIIFTEEINHNVDPNYIAHRKTQKIQQLIRNTEGKIHNFFTTNEDWGNVNSSAQYIRNPDKMVKANFFYDVAHYNGNFHMWHIIVEMKNLIGYLKKEHQITSKQIREFNDIIDKEFYDKNFDIIENFIKSQLDKCSKSKDNIPKPIHAAIDHEDF